MEQTKQSCYSLKIVTGTYRFFFMSPANIFLFKLNNRNTRKSCEICSKLTTKIPERR